MFSRILIPLDGSETAEAVLTQLRPLLCRTDAEALLARVVGWPPVIGDDVSATMAALEAMAREYLQAVEQRLVAQGMRVRSIVRRGWAPEAILEIAREQGASLVAMTTHGRTGIARWALGSVAEKVMRASPVPVLAVRSLGVPARELALRSIVVAIDSSEVSLAVVPAAIEVARHFGARAMLVNVCEGGSDCNVPVPQMAHAHEEFRKAGVPVEPLMMKGDAASAILDACAERKADLIALATHGRSGVSRWMLGSVAERVLRAATVPLLIVRSPEERKKVTA